ncbi:GNAT family N-acetyltransferase [Pacificoceanicola onchidii]|uniref:GNAT family N-acetyltransferase n=1 Tax=Pacificoceanicola onchidii TaxID=2562685 RepID=UPI0010A4361F|nr:GNAT family N-acetyltransferase [Pacificoceanicola onchidii]
MSSNATITTDRLTLRPIQKRDAEAMTAMMLGHWEMRGYGLWAVTETGAADILGMVGPFFPDGWPETEIGWVMFDGAEGKGYAFEAAKAAISDARTRLGWRDIVHYINPENSRSIALAERLGAVLDPNAEQPKPGSHALIYRQPQEAA